MGAALVVSPQTLWKFGGYETVARGTPIHLVGQVNNGVGESRYTRLMVPGAAAGYVVTAGRTLVLTRIIVVANVATGQWHLVSADAAIGDNVVAAPAGVISEDSPANNVRNALGTPTADTSVTFEYYADVAAGRGVGFRVMTASTLLNVYAVGVEV